MTGTEPGRHPPPGAPDAGPTTGRWARSLDWLRAPESPAPLHRLRVLLGLLFAASGARFLTKGWVEPLYAAPSFRFVYPGWAWVPEPPGWGIELLLALTVVAGLLVAAGRLYRPAALVLFVAFTWVELLDPTAWLNHYYLMSLLGGILVILPLHRPGPFPRWMRLWVLLQVAIVYGYAGVAKWNADWLLRGEPLAAWLRNLGVDSVPLALGMSWAGMLYDCTIPAWLAWRRTRPYAFATVVGFHAVVGLLFPIGVFPFVMVALALTFFPGGSAAGRVAPRVRGLAVAAGWMVVQVLLPLRFLVAGPDVNWTEAGFRFAWRVMLVNKSGYVSYRVVEHGTGRTWEVSPRDELSPMQLEQMATQGDLVVQYARHLAARFRTEGHDVAVYADSFVSWNGRPSARYVDPAVDLAGELPARWILPAPP